jgi:hypothetical protein
MKKIFTKRFSNLTPADQSAVVAAAIRDLESCIGRHLNPEDDGKVEKQIDRIRQRAVEYGVYTDDRGRPHENLELPGQGREVLNPKGQSFDEAFPCPKCGGKQTAGPFDGNCATVVCNQCGTTGQLILGDC